MKKIIFFLTLISISALSADINLKKCTSCHGANFEKKALGKSKVVADMNTTDIVVALKGYKVGTYGGAMKGLMKGQVANMSDTDINVMAEKIKEVK